MLSVNRCRMELKKNDSKAGTKGIVERDVVRIITPGTLTEDTMLEDKDNNYLLSLFIHDDMVGLSWVDISTGKIHGTGC